MGKKKININLILGVLIVLFSVVLGGEIYLLLTRTNEEAKPTPTPTSSPTPVADDDDDYDVVDDILKQEENREIAGKVASAIYQLKWYQLNNGDQVPIGFGEGMTTWTYFEKEYMRNGSQNVFNDTEDRYAGYKFVFCDSFGTGGCKDSTKLTYETDKNIIYVSAQAICDIDVVKKSPMGRKKVAMYVVGQVTSKDVIEPVYCEDNTK